MAKKRKHLWGSGRTRGPQQTHDENGYPIAEEADAPQQKVWSEFDLIAIIAVGAFIGVMCAGLCSGSIFWMAGLVLDNPK